MKYCLIIVVILFFACREVNHPVKNAPLKVEQNEQEVKIKIKPLDTLISIDERKDDSLLLATKRKWIENDSLLLKNFLEDIFIKEHLGFSNFLYFFGEHSELEIGKLLERYGEKAIDKSKLIYASPLEFSSLTMEEIKAKMINDIGSYQNINSISFLKKDIDINWFSVKITGENNSSYEYKFLTNSSDGVSHFIVDILNKKTSIINNQVYD